MSELRNMCRRRKAPEVCALVHVCDRVASSVHVTPGCRRRDQLAAGWVVGRLRYTGVPWGARTAGRRGRQQAESAYGPVAPAGSADHLRHPGSRARRRCIRTPDRAVRTAHCDDHKRLRDGLPDERPTHMRDGPRRAPPTSRLRECLECGRRSVLRHGHRAGERPAREVRDPCGRSDRGVGRGRVTIEGSAGRTRVNQ